jgi:hypothetical protein
MQKNQHKFTAKSQQPLSDRTCITENVSVMLEPLSPVISMYPKDIKPSIHSPPVCKRTITLHGSPLSTVRSALPSTSNIVPGSTIDAVTVLYRAPFQKCRSARRCAQIPLKIRPRNGPGHNVTNASGGRSGLWSPVRSIHFL